MGAVHLSKRPDRRLMVNESRIGWSDRQKLATVSGKTNADEGLRPADRPRRKPGMVKGYSIGG
jgi:hypothetical protein